jgi:hypothetical protein
MSDFEDLCEMYNIGSNNSENLINIILKEDALNDKLKREEYALEIGRHVHIIWLTTNTPATVVKVELNTILEERVVFDYFNELCNPSFEHPGSWFVRKGFTVRSRKFDGYWLQYAFSNSGQENITRSEIMEYLDIVNIPYNEMDIDDCFATKLSIS